MGDMADPEGYSVREVAERSELDAVVDIIWKAQYDPYMPSSSMLFPILGYTAADRSEALAASKNRLWNDLQSDDSGHRGWIYVSHRDSQVVAGAQWEWHDASPFPNGRPRVSIHWWPEGEARKFCEFIFNQAYTPRSIFMQRGHGGINTMVVHPAHRGRGVGGLIIRWTNRRLDEKGAEGFLEASELGRKCYERHGYQVIMKLDFFIPSDSGDEWKKMFHDWKPDAWYSMWRPPHGTIGPATRNRPWQLGPSLPA